MSYASYKEFTAKYDIERIGQATDDIGQSEAVEEFVNIFLQDASSFIDTYLRPRYVVPVTQTSYELRRACCIIAWHDIDRRRGGNPEDDRHIEYDEIIEWLKDVQNGEADLPNVPVRSERAAVFSSETNLYTEEEFKNY